MGRHRWRCSALPSRYVHGACIILGFAATFICITPVHADILRYLPAILSGNPSCTISYEDDDPKYDLAYLGLYYFRPDMSHESYRLPQLTDQEFNALSLTDRRKVADTLLSSLFYGYPADILKQKITSRDFLCSVRKGLFEKTNNMVWVEEEIRDDTRFYHSEWAINEVYDILARFYAMEDLDQNYLYNWIAYILTQTIMFSPAYELDSSHYPNVASVYNWLVLDLDDDLGMRYSTYLHMASSDNWRRFRSPEDNGREMLEIYTYDFDDANVPKSATCLQNWYLDEDADTLVVGLNQNTIPQALFDTTVTTGFDFYRELVKSQGFINGTVRRLVEFFFTDRPEVIKNQITSTIVSSNPETWQDILLQIVFSKEYLLHTTRVKSAEELFYSTIKKLDYKHYRYSFYYFANALEDMNQASMKYKLGKLERTPLDTLSFAEYHKFMREMILVRSVCGEFEETTYDEWNTFGWRPPLLGDDRFSYIEEDPEASLTSFVSYLFNFMLHRDPLPAELEMFKQYMLTVDRTDYLWSYRLWYIDELGCYSMRENAAEDVLDYMSRLTEFYTFQEVEQ